MKLLLTAITAFLLAIVIPSVSATFCDGDINLSINPNSVKVAPGGTAVIEVTVTNKGEKETVDVVKLFQGFKKCSGNSGMFWDSERNKHCWESYFSESGEIKIQDIKLDRDSSRTYHLQVNIPPNAKVGKYQYAIFLRDFDKGECECHLDLEVGGIELIPEFSTIAIPVGIALIAGLFFFRKQ